ncbi:MAG: hypothetical protein WCB49_07410 [Gammaproteobacteria bacterium]
MRKASRIVLEVIAGFFFYTALLAAFTGALPIAGNIGLFALFAVPALAALLCGLALDRFRHWKRDTGIVVISSSALSLFVVITVASMFATREFRQMAPPNSIQFLKDYHYIAGSIVMAGLATLGLTLTWFDKNALGRRRHGTAPD